MKLTKYQFLSLFTQEEMAGILAAAKQIPAIQAWVFLFENLTPDENGLAVDTDTADLRNGITGFEQAGLLAPGRAQEILATQTTESGDIIETIVLATGQQVLLDPAWHVQQGGNYPVTALVTVINPQGLSAAYPAYYIATGTYK